MRLTTLLALFFVSSQSLAFASPETTRLLTAIDGKFRSSDRSIPAKTLLEEALPKIGATYLKQLIDLSRDELVAAMKEAETGLSINQGVAENLLKIQQMATNCHGLCQITSFFGDQVTGLPQAEIDQIVTGFPKQTPHRDNEFSNVEYEQQRLIVKSVLDNDLYNFKVGALYHAQGWNDSRTVTFSMFARGKPNRPYIIAAGVQQVLDLLKNIHFTEAEIQYLRGREDFSHVTDEYWNYLRTFRFTGTVRAVRDGTVVLANEPILEVVASPVEAQIVETLIIPIVNAMSNTATKTYRIAQAANGRPVVEGGTRRSYWGVITATGAIIGGAAGTSNAHVARVMGVNAFGSQNHASVMSFDEEIDAQIAYGNQFPGATHLVDTNSIEQGVKMAVRAVGKKLKGIRLDSTIPGKNYAETTDIVRGWLKNIGYEHVSITYSDKMQENVLSEMPNAPFQIALVGTEIASPSDAPGLGMVYKLSEIRDQSGNVYDPIKQTPGKMSLPGQKQIFRVTDANGNYLKDVIGQWGDPAPVNSKPLMSEVMTHGKQVVPRETLTQAAAFVKEQMPLFPASLLNLNATMADGFFKFEISPQLLARQQKSAVHQLADTSNRVGVFFGTFNPLTEDDVRFIERAKHLYNFQEVVIVPTPASGDPELKVKALHQKFPKAAGYRIYRGFMDKDVFNGTDVMRGIQSELGSTKTLSIAMREYTFQKSYFWADANHLAQTYDWVVGADATTSKLALSGPIRNGLIELDGRHYKTESGRRFEMVDLAHVCDGDLKR